MVTFSTEAVARTLMDTSHCHCTTNHDEKYVEGDDFKISILYQNTDLVILYQIWSHYRPELISESLSMKLNRTILLLLLLHSIFTILPPNDIKMFFIFFLTSHSDL